MYVGRRELTRPLATCSGVASQLPMVRMDHRGYDEGVDPRRRRLIARPHLHLLYRLFKIALWCTEAVGEWMVRLANLYRAVIRYEGSAERAIIVVGGSMALALWGLSRLAFLALYLPTLRIQQVLSAADW